MNSLARSVACLYIGLFKAMGQWFNVATGIGISLTRMALEFFVLLRWVIPLFTVRHNSHNCFAMPNILLSTSTHINHNGACGDKSVYHNEKIKRFGFQLSQYSWKIFQNTKAPKPVFECYLPHGIS
jgi:hypothetical protein